MGMYTDVSFIVFAEKTGIPTRLAQSIIDAVVQKAPEALELVRRSFLSDEAKSKYIDIFNQRRSS